MAKNVFCWLSTLPFLVTIGNPNDAVRGTVILALVSAVYSGARKPRNATCWPRMPGTANTTHEWNAALR
ncbi:MAG: hypothetical protein V4579_00120 [Pseudomonadota bacterium]